MTQSQTQSSTPTPPKKKHRIRNFFLLAFLLLLIFIALLPTLLSFGPGKAFVLAQVNSRSTYQVQVDSLSLGWFSPASAQTIKIVDADSKPVADIAALSTPITVLHALSGNLDGSGMINLTQITYSGFTAGKGDIPFSIAGKILTLPNSSPIPLNGGTLTIGGSADLNKSPILYTVDKSKPVPLLAKVQLNQKIAADQLYFLPFAWAKDQDLVAVTGTLNVTILDASLPLNAEKMKTEGTLHTTLSINNLNTNFPLVTAILKAIGPIAKITQTDWGIKDYNLPDIAITLDKGHISYSNLIIKAGPVALTFSGTVGVDKSLDMNVTVQEASIPIPLPPIHITGTTSAPKLDLLGGGTGGSDPLKGAADLLNQFSKPK